MQTPGPLNEVAGGSLHFRVVSRVVSRVSDP